VLAAAVGIAGVVAVFVGVLSIAEGFRAAMKVTGSPDVAIVLRKSADTEMTSGLGRDETRLITDAPGIARDTNGPLTSAELFVIINLPKRIDRLRCERTLSRPEPSRDSSARRCKNYRGPVLDAGS